MAEKNITKKSDSIEITYFVEHVDAPQTFYIGRAKRKDLKQLIEAQNILIEKFVFANASVAEVVSNDENWALIEGIATILPIVGVPGKTLLDYLHLIEDDYRILCDLFFGENWQGVVGSQEIEPSQISKLHLMDYQGAAGKAVEKLREEQTKTTKRKRPKETKESQT